METDDHKGLSHALHVLGVAAQMTGDLETARHYMAQRLQGARESGDLVTINSEAANLSVVERQLGNLDRAQELAREALEIAHARGDEWAIPYDLNGFAAIALERGELERAAKLLSAAEVLLQAQGASWPPDEAHHFEATRRRLVEAMTDGAFAHAWAAGHVMSSATAVSYALAPPL